MYIWNPRDRLTMFKMVIAAYNLENTSKFCNVLQFFLRIHTIGAFKREFHFTDAIHLFSYTNFESCDEQIIECSVFSWKLSESAMNVILDKTSRCSSSLLLQKWVLSPSWCDELWTEEYCLCPRFRYLANHVPIIRRQISQNIIQSYHARLWIVFANQ